MNDETGACIGSNLSGGGGSLLLLRATATADNRAEEAACRSNLDRRGTNLCVARGRRTAAERQRRRIWPPRRQILFLRAQKRALGGVKRYSLSERLTPRTAGESHW
eukprot:COSAG01_NODE_1783_length_9239_cov_12.422101_2_plen_106_part_00